MSPAKGLRPMFINQQNNIIHFQILI
jgi:hypothetical protein